MADVQINEVHTEMEITDSGGGLGPAELKKVVQMVIEHLKAQQDQEALRRCDDAIRNRAYVSDLKE